MRTVVVGLLVLGVVVGAVLGWWWLVGVAGVLLAVALYDVLQRTHAVLRNYPVVGHLRYLLELVRPELQQYFIERNFDGRPYDRDTRSIIYQRAKGIEGVKAFGTERNVNEVGYEYLVHATAPVPLPPQPPRVRIGGPHCTQPYDMALLNVSAMSFGALSANAIMALNKGAALGGFYHDTGEGGLCRYHRSHGGDLVWEIGSGYFGCRDGWGQFDPAKFAETAQIDQVKMVEIKLSQGAKPGHGGVLPAAKVSREISDARGVPQGQDCVSPAAHSTFSTPIELLEWAARLRELSGGKPVGAKFCVGQPHEVFALMKAVLETGIRLDFITVDGAEGGTGAAPVELSNSMGMPLREGLIMVRNALVGCGLKGETKIAAAGKVHSGAGMAKNFALGADWCNAARGFMFALGCVQSMRCHTDTCPTGVATQDITRQRGLVVEDKAGRVARFQRQTLMGLREMVISMGLDSPWDIKPHHVRERVNAVRSDAIDRIYDFLQEGELLEAGEGTAYARHWKAARADSFKPAS